MPLNLEKKKKQDILIATDPDCDRVACMVRDNNGGDFIPLNGNQTGGALMVEYIIIF